MTCAAATTVTMMWLIVFVACTALWGAPTGLMVLAAMIVAHCVIDELINPEPEP